VVAVAVGFFVMDGWNAVMIPHVRPVAVMTGFYGGVRGFLYNYIKIK
jgi:hypothetical protein